MSKIQHSNHMNDEEIVGFENDTTRIIQLLIQGTNDLDVVPIVGMGGQGKTTFARKLYNKKIVVSHFDVRAWCVVSQTYNRRDLLQEIFSQVTSSTDRGYKEDVLADMLKKSLTGKRYLIVLDDMWDGMAWDDIRLSFPYVGNKSRIIVTTRLKKVGDHVMHHTNPYSLPFLTPEESCHLLQKKVFQQEGCPPELHDVSLEIAKRCKGLPLVVVLAAGIIKRKQVEQSWWHEVKNALFSYLGDELEGYGRAVSKLISLWIAEGFVQNNESGRLTKEVAEGYLMDLISSNMVMVSGRRYNGEAKYCQVHDVVLHFCLEMSRKEKFMSAVKGHYSHFQPFDWEENRVSFNFIDERSDTTLVASKTEKTIHQHLSSLVALYGTYGRRHLRWNPFPHISNWTHIKVLELRYLRIPVLSSTTLDPLINLKYLSVFAAQFDFHPESHLYNLETLLVLTLLIHKVMIPANFWKMEKLRHVEIDAISNFENNKQQIFDESSRLENLRILKKVEFPIDDADEVAVLLQRCPNLQELEMIFVRNHGVNDSSKIFPKLEWLTQLQALDLFFVGDIVVSELHLPSHLKKLTLRGPNIVNAASSVAGLPNLEYLHLMWDNSEEWCLGDITFNKLKFLKLDGLHMSRWDATEESFPMLETLAIDDCRGIQEIPLCFADILTLKQIKLNFCESESLEASAQKIKEEAEATDGCGRIDLVTGRWYRKGNHG